MPKMQLLGIAEAAAAGAHLSQVGVLSHSTDKFSSDVSGLLNVPKLESRTSSAALQAAIGSCIGGKRTMVSASPLMSESVYTASYMRLPIVMVNATRTLGTLSARNDHSDLMALRDSGVMLFMPESSAEAVETIVQAYKVCEEVMLPAVVGIDMRNAYESAMLPNEQFTRRFLGKFSPPVKLSKPVFVAGPSEHSEFRKSQQKSMHTALSSIEKSSAAWKKKFKKGLPAVDHYKTEDADHILVMAGYNSTTAKAAVNRMRAGGKKAGLLRLRAIRPWPASHIISHLANAKKVAVLDQSISIGKEGPLYSDIRPYCKHLHGFVSLGSVLAEKDFISMFDKLHKSEKEETVWL